MKPLLSLLFMITVQASAQDKITNLHTLFDTLSARKDFSGCVLMAENGKVVYEKAIGYADADKGIPLSINTLFELGSVSKQFTAMAIMQLKEQGKLSYDDALGKYFPALLFKGVTIRHLLTHTSGIPDVLGWNKQQLDTSRVNYNADILQKLPQVYDSTIFAPGTLFSYSNTNYLLLAQIVEKVSGEPFPVYMKTHVFIPAGMKRTMVYSRRSAKKTVTDYALSYAWDPRNNKFMEADSMAPGHYNYYLDGIAGPYGISSNVEDLLQWDQALYTEQLVKKATLEEAFTPFHLKDGNAGYGEGADYGFGWILSVDSARGRVTWHSGSWASYTSVMARYTDKHKTIILLSNSEQRQPVMTLMGLVDHILFDTPYTLPEKINLPHSIIVADKQLQTLTGSYKSILVPGMQMLITAKGDRLFAKLSTQASFEIYPSSDTSFFYTIVPATIKFEKETPSAQQKLTLYQNGQEYIMIREHQQ
ncbi:CubicO group peptidase (beta-lactamase class C family) [Chitinophaga niastensis]|uniref:Beta-lactamase n=2 Tax=Chitinophaga niastensis TaxID=536980 RepID=A0A2P8HF51_CHINA|nr:CubicO group peptidase (beta-lactamase class C family) [Chitinophaga niastensis]